MEKSVEKIIDVSSKVGTIQRFSGSAEEAYKILKCKEPDCPIEVYAAQLRKIVFDPMFDYDVRRDFFIKFSNDSHEVFWGRFNLQQKSKENFKNIVHSFEVLSGQKEAEVNKEKHLLQLLIAEKNRLEQRIEYLFQKDSYTENN